MRISTLIAGMALAGLTALAGAQAPIVIKFSHVVANDTPKGKASRVLRQDALAS